MPPYEKRRLSHTGEKDLPAPLAKSEELVRQRFSASRNKDEKKDEDEKNEIAMANYASQRQTASDCRVAKDAPRNDKMI